jgi:hypothetical protein
LRLLAWASASLPGGAWLFHSLDRTTASLLRASGPEGHTLQLPAEGVGASHQPIEHELRDLCLRTARIDLLQPAAQLPLVLPGAVIPAKQPFSFAGVEWSERQQKGLKCAF